jgi:hypothetical protein
MSDVCASCKAPLIWAKTGRDKWMPVDSEPTEGGYLLLSHRHVGEPPVAVVLTRATVQKLQAEHERSPQDGPLRLFTSHFATCPDAAAHRKRSVPRSGTPAPQGAHNQKQEAR